MSHNIEHLAHPSIRDLTPYQPGKPIAEVQRELGLDKVIKLASNENPLGPSPLAIASAKACLDDNHLYPDPNGFNLKNKLAAHLNIQPTQITLGNGSDTVLALIAQAFLHPGQEAVISQYGFATFAIITQAMRGVPRIVPAREYAHDLPAMLAAINDKTKLIFIANPNNPSGTWLNATELNDFLQKVPSDILVIVDEAYFEYINIAEYPDTIALQSTYPNLITTRTFSKLYGLAGLRVGYSISSPAISDYLNRVRLPYNVSTPALCAAEAALSDEEHLLKSLECNAKGMQKLSTGLQKLGLNYIPSVTNFITVDVGQEAAPVFQAMLKQGVIVRPLLPYGLPQHLRISIGTEAEISRCLEVLDNVLSTGL